MSYAYFAPYSMGKHKSLIADLQCAERVRLEMLGETLDGHDMTLLRIGEILNGHYTVLLCIGELGRGMA